MSIRRAAPDDLATMARVAAACQADPERYVAYAGDDPATIAAEVTEFDGWPDVSVVAVEDDAIVGWLLADRDPEMGRVWWWGPFVDVAEPAAWADVADRLLAAAEELASSLPERELAPDGRSRRFADLASRHGYHADPGSVLLRLDPSDARLDAPSPVEVVPLTDDWASETAALQDELFAGTHTSGAALVAAHDARHPRHVALLDGRFAGYVAVEHQADSSAYVDFLGVDPELRQRGIGRRLVAHAVREAFERGATHAHLSVREANAAARALYASLGFVEERILQPYRAGFTLP